jgi:hypothetical protein
VDSVDARPLTAVERATLLRLTEPTLFDGAAEYRRQVDHAMVVGRCDCGCPTIDLAIDRSVAPRSPRPGTPLLPVEGVLDQGEDHLRLICFARDGWLETLELVYVASRPPAGFPDPREWQLIT